MVKNKLLFLLLPAAVILAALSVLLRQSSHPPVTPGSVQKADYTAVKLIIPQTGLYEVTLSDLEAAGWGDVNPAQLRLFYMGREQPLWVQRQSKSFTVRFYGEATFSQYTRDNVYWLRADGGPVRAMEEQVKPAAQLAPVLQYEATVHAEENLVYAPQVREGEHWFWQNLPAPQSVSFPITLTSVAPGPGQVIVHLWGSTSSLKPPDHRHRILINGKPVADDTWSGQVRHTITAEVPSGVLVEGVNVVKIEAPGLPGVLADIAYLDWIKVIHPRFLVAQSDQLEFVSPGEVVQLSGFSGPVTLFDVTEPERIARLAGSRVQQQQGRAIAQVDRGRRYLAIGPKGMRHPARVIAVATSPDLRAPGLGADYIAIGPPDLLQPFQPLLQWRQSQGLKVMAVPVESIYDQFDNGLPEPEAIRSFLEYAVRSYQPAPQYVVLVGDATYDPKGYISSSEANRVPTFLVLTIYGGETASDPVFVEFEDEAKPKLSVGRIPAREPQQVKTLVAKTLAYEQKAPVGDWRRRILAVADGQEASFKRDAEDFIALFPPNDQTVLFNPPAGTANANQQVKRYWDEGNWLIAYFGHGSINQWGKDQIFTAADVATLSGSDNRFPVVLNMTCLAGLFTHPKIMSLAETLLWSPDSGTVATLAPTSLTLAVDQSFLSKALVQALLVDPKATLGQAFVRAQRQVPTDDPGARDVMQTFLFFGDPALRLVSAQ